MGEEAPKPAVTTAQATRWPPNPFSPGTLLGADWFAGREEALEQLRKAVRDNWSVVVVRGPRGIGKTALLRRLLADSDLRGVYVDARDHVDAQDIGRPEAALRRIIQGLSEEISFDYDLPIFFDPSKATDQDFVRVVLRQLCTADAPRLVLAIDEVDFLDAEAIRRIIRFAGRLNKLPRPPLWALVVGETWGQAPEQFFISEREPTIRLGLLERKEVSELLGRFPDHSLFSFSSKAQEAVWEETGGHPLFLSTVFDALYDLRWPQDDSSPIVLEDVRRAIDRIEISPPERIMHALRQAGPAAQRVLFTLAKEGQLSASDIIEVFQREWPGWEHEVGFTLESLLGAGLLRNENGTWVHRIPLLGGYFARSDREKIAAGDRPPRPDSWVAFRRGEELEREGLRDEALDAYEEAKDLDPEFWLPRWHLSRLLLERARKSHDPESREKDLREAKRLLEALDAEAAMSSSIHRSIRALLCQALVDFAGILLPPTNAERKEILSLLQELDRRLDTNGAAELVAQTAVAIWSHKLRDSLSSAWSDRTREFLRGLPYVGSTRLRQELVRWLVKRLDDGSKGEEELEESRDLVRYVVPVVLEEGNSEAECFPLWGALRVWLRRYGQAIPPESSVCLEPWAWETMLLFVPPDVGEGLLDAIQFWFEHDFKLELTGGSEGEDAADRLVRILIHPEFEVRISEDKRREFFDRIWSLMDDLVGKSNEDAGLRELMLAPLGRVLGVLYASGQMRQSDREAIETLRYFYVSSWPQGSSKKNVSIAALESWDSLLAHSLDERSIFPRLVPGAKALIEDALDEKEKESIELWLDNQYELSKRIPISLPGISKDELRNVLSAYLAYSEGNEKVLVRVFRLRSPNPETAQLMWAIWDRERRALGILSANPAGRALLRLRDARRIEDDNVALLVTEWMGTWTLQDELRRDRTKSLREKLGRVTFWTHFIPVLEAVEGLHRSGFLHRTLSPEVIYLYPYDGEINPSWRQDPAQLSPVLRLCHFEWSVYLRGLMGRGRFRRKALDRYTAPETLRAALGISHRIRGETFASDLYSLGLILYECLVEVFQGEEDLSVYGSAEAYGREGEYDHEQWLRGLRRKVVEARREGRITAYEELVLLPFLEFDVFKRPTSLEETITILRQGLLRESTQIEDSLPVFTTLSSILDDPREDFRCVAFFLRRPLPEVDIADKRDLHPAALAGIIRAELQGASVFLNQNQVYPLILRSRTGVLYRLQRLDWEQREFPDVAFLQVARPHEGDSPVGARLSVLQGSVQVFDIERQAISNFIKRRRPGKLDWRDLFNLADQQVAVRAEKVQQAERERLIRILGISIEAEYNLTWREAPFVRVRPGASLVRSLDPAVNLAKTVSAWLSRDLIIEIAKRRTPAGMGIEIGLDSSAIDVDAEVVDLSQEIEPEELPDEGVLRPSANRGVAALYQRRRRVLNELRNDALLLDVVVDPITRTTKLPRESKGLEFYIGKKLDEDKQEIVRRCRYVRPLVVVQGPPGTGKTTLATEIVLQKLRESSNARILVTAQGHSPLDNLLERLLKERELNAKAKELLDQVEIVRIPSGNRTDLEYPKSVRKYLPYERADELFRRLRKQCEQNLRDRGIHGKVARIINDRLAPYASAPNSLLRRVEESANLVFVTTSAREVEVEAPVSFDLVIVEEAARCVPIELLGVMRLARQWLLIGDHQQLPPFGFEYVQEGVRDHLNSLQEELVVRRQQAENDNLKSSLANDLENEELRIEEIRRDIPIYLDLFRHLHEDSGPEALHAATLKTQWRMHPTLGKMVSDVFYGGQAVRNPPGEESVQLAKRTKHPFREPEYLRDTQLVWIDFDPMVDIPVCGEVRGPGGELENPAERRTAVAFLRQLKASRQVPDIAILTPYRRQAEEFRGLLRQDRNWFEAFGVVEERIFTVDSFQGRQAGTVVLSLVRNNIVDPRQPYRGVGFLSEKRRATVMFSRAEQLLVMLGCSAQFLRFSETEWMIDIYKRAHKVHWTSLLTRQERTKIEQQYRSRAR